MDKKSDKDFSIEIDGQTVDTRKGMTRAVYRAFIAEAQAKGTDLLPDSQPLSKKNSEPWTTTWLTGEAVRDDFYAPVADVYDGQVDEYWGLRMYNDCDRRVRPAVVEQVD